MNNFELADRLICHPVNGKREYEVVIRLDQPSIGYCAAARIEQVNHGIDWDMDRILLEPDKPLVAWDYLEHYIPDIREQIAAIVHERDMQAWRDMNKGRTDGVN